MAMVEVAAVTVMTQRRGARANIKSISQNGARNSPPFFAYAPLRALFFLRAVVFMFQALGLASPPLRPQKKDGLYG